MFQNQIAAFKQYIISDILDEIRKRDGDRVKLLEPILSKTKSNHLSSSDSSHLLKTEPLLMPEERELCYGFFSDFICNLSDLC